MTVTISERDVIILQRKKEKETNRKFFKDGSLPNSFAPQLDRSCLPLVL